MDFIDQHRDRFGIEPICKVLPIAPSTYFAHAARRLNPDLRSDRAKRDAVLIPEVQRVHRENFEVYGVRKVWRQMRREGFDIARCTVQRLMKHLDLKGVVRGKVVRTTIANPATPCPLDHVNRQFKATRPNELWVSDFTYVSTWQGFVYVAFVIDVYARRIVGWRASSTPHTDFVLDALEQALYERRPRTGSRLVAHSDRGRIGRITTGSVAIAPPTIVKSFGAANIALNGSTSLSFTISNPNAGASLTGIGFTDALPAGLTVSTPNALAGSCDGGTITAVAGSGSISLASATLASSASCTFSVNVAGTAVGTQNNTTGAVTSVEGGTGGTASASITVVGIAPPPAPATSIPTLQQWALGLLGLLILAATAAVMRHQRRRD